MAGTHEYMAMEQLWKLECSGEASYLAMAELVADPRELVAAAARRAPSGSK